ncbi:MAG: hypothetical protein HY909_12645 [Deltaproteobacteria bacterium]|nr:hypothetical protein [Deltaproteobacteria bacterium]
MRREWALAWALGCSQDPAVAVTDGAVGDAQDAPSGPTVQCPAPLGAPRERAPPRPSGHPLDDALRLNHLQAKATHNSYHLRSRFAVPEWDYAHAPLTTQLESQGVRGIELDPHWNVDCGRFEVYHVLRFDEETTCRLFTECLEEVRRWSDAHPGHHPLFIQLEPKDGDATTEARLLALEREALSVFPRALVLTPDEVRGTSQTLREAVLSRGWPTLGAARGRVLFYLNDSGAPRAAYTRGGTSLDGRLFFAEASSVEAPYAAVLILNGQVRERDAITAAVRQGFLVRTFAETSLAAGRGGDRTGLESALSGGAHIVSTDFAAPEAPGGYVVEIPGGTPSRCNPVSAPSGCTSLAVEDPSRLGR